MAASRSIGVTASRPCLNETAVAPARPSLIRACWSVIRFSSGSGISPKRSSSSVAQLDQLGVLARARDPAVHVDLRLLVRDVVRGHVRVDVDVQAHRLGRFRTVLLRIHLAHGLVEHLHVELEAERRDVAGLLVAEQVAGAAQLEVAHRDLEARAQLRVVAQRAQPVRGLGASAPPRSGTAGTRRRARASGPTRPRIW